MITTCLNIQVTRIKEVIAEGEDVLIFRQILRISFIRNVWRSEDVLNENMPFYIRA